MNIPRPFAAALLSALGLVAMPSDAHAIAWCAQPLEVHEWGVHVFDGGGAPGAGVPTPAWFHTPGDHPRVGVPVRDLDPDSGERALPVVHFYASSPFNRGSIPVGIEVGFSAGAASAWYPAVDHLQPAARANGPAAVAARAQLLSQRAARHSDPRFWRNELPALPPDPTRQLVWDRLDLSTAAPARPPADSDAAWVRAARAIDGALWVNGRAESDRFLFYEGRTVERVPLALRRAAGWRPDHRRYTLENTGPDPVHDVFLVHNERGASYVFEVATLPAGGRADFVLEDHAVEDRAAATTAVLRARLVDPAGPRAPEPPRFDRDSCVEGRDPAIPTERAVDHHLYAAEADLLLATWGERFFARSGTTVVYREDLATLDRVMPLSVYTDMYSYPVVHRAGLALWEGVRLP